MLNMTFHACLRQSSKHVENSFVQRLSGFIDADAGHGSAFLIHLKKTSQHSLTHAGRAQADSDNPTEATRMMKTTCQFVENVTYT